MDFLLGALRVKMGANGTDELKSAVDNENMKHYPACKGLILLNTTVTCKKVDANTAYPRCLRRRIILS